MKLIASGLVMVAGIVLSGCIANLSSTAAQTDQVAGSLEETQSRRPRVIVTSDFPPIDVIPGSICNGAPAERCSDPDDVQSMVRFLLYANDLEVEALIASAGTFANIADKQHILNMLDLYDEIDENLRRHDQRYPTADELRSVTWTGMDGAIGTEDFAGGSYRPIESLIGPKYDTEASDAIVRILDAQDPRPVWVCVWGGSRELAQAIWKIKTTRSQETFEQVIAKLRVYMVAKQDYTADWLLNEFPRLFIILSEKNYQGMFWSSGDFETETVNAEWVETNLRDDHGPLGAAYPESGFVASKPGIWEGDTPSFLHIVSGVRGINDPEQPGQAGWGGKFVQPDSTRNHWFDHPDGPQSVYKWRVEIQEDLARRADWMLPRD